MNIQSIDECKEYRSIYRIKMNIHNKDEYTEYRRNYKI